MNREIEGSFLTRKGLRLIDKLLASKASLRLTRACAGDGLLEEGQNPKLFDQLLHQTADLSIAGIYNAEGGEAVMRAFMRRTRTRGKSCMPMRCWKSHSGSARKNIRSATLPICS